MPSDSVKIRVSLVLQAATGKAYFDGVQLIEGYAPCSYNLIENSSFESYSGAVPASWEGYSSINLSSSADTVTTAQHEHGTRSFRIKGDVALAKGIVQKLQVNGTESDTYIVSGWGKADSVPTDSNRRFQIYIRVKYLDGTQKDKPAADFNPDVSGWQYVTKAFTLSDETDTNKTPTAIWIYMIYSKEANYAYFDNISLVKEPAASYTYDSEGNLISVVENDKQNSQMEYNSDNQITKSVDPKGGHYDYTYYTDTNDNPTMLHTAKTQRGAVYSYDYDDHGIAESVVGKYPETNSSLKIKSTQSVSHPTSSSITYTVTSYDTRGNHSVATYNAKNGTLLSVTDPVDDNNSPAIATTYDYDSYNDSLNWVEKDSNRVTYSYDDSYKYLTGVTSPSSTHYSFTYDGFGNRTETKVGTQTLATYTYGAGGGPLIYLDYGNGDYIQYLYDKYGNISAKRLNGSLVYRGYSDNTGAVTKAVDKSNNLEYRYVYDSTDRLISTTVLNTTTNTRKAEYEYDFDLNNNVTKVSTKTSTSSDTVAYSYGEDNLPMTAAMPSGTTATYSYDGLGRLTDSSLNTVNPVNKAYTYEAANDYGTGYTTNLIKTETINGDTYEYGYDDAGNINCIKKKRSNDPDFTDIAAYQYDSLGQLITSTDKENNIMYVYTYYPGGNLHKEKIYDISGNTTVLIDSITYTYDDTAWEDLLTGYDGNVIVYDEIGNPETYRDGIELKWTNGRQLQSYSKNNQTTTYTYDTNGMRLAKNVNGLQYTYLYNGGKLMQETRGNDIVDYFYDANGQAVALRHKTSSNDSGTYYYYAYNFRGDILGLYNAAGSLYRTYTYDAWGNILSVKDANGTDITSQTDIAHLQSLRYREYVYDTESGLYYLQSRYYDPVTRRFINADGLVSTGTGVLGYNMFAYCENNPISRFDCSGERYDEPFYIINTNKKYANKKAANELFSNTIKDFYDGKYSFSVPVQNIPDCGCDFFELIEYYDADTYYTVVELTQLIVDYAYSKGNEDYYVDYAGQRHLFGEILFHLDGYLVWDKNNTDSIFAHCKTIELTIGVGGNVNDYRENILLQLIINSSSGILGQLY